MWISAAIAGGIKAEFEIFIKRAGVIDIPMNGIYDTGETVSIDIDDGMGGDQADMDGRGHL